MRLSACAGQWRENDACTGKGNVSHAGAGLWKAKSQGCLCDTTSLAGLTNKLFALLADTQLAALKSMHFDKVSMHPGGKRC
mmetsp:Transcript_17155/g.51484  ORF Transcript_17155/g.51484 Transcript_17155/m.51484 type:complete len:81 (-) Transcript_17155:74-316(-)